MVTFDQLVAAYQERKARVEALEEEAKRKVGPIKEEMKKLEAAMQLLLQSQGLKSAPTASGTCYLSKWTSVKVECWDELLPWIKENDRWDVLPRAVNKTAVMEDISEGSTPPGVRVTQGIKVNVRRS
jgi:hypothetical protein